VAVVAVITAVVVIVSNNKSHRITLATPVTTKRGGVVFSDDFADPHSGWNVKPSTGVTYQYTSHGFSATASGNFIYHRGAPYEKPIPQISMSMTATIAPGAPAGANFGPNCDQGPTTSADLHYEFELTTDSQWEILRHQGVATNTTEILKEGSAPVAAGPTPDTVVGICATQTDGHTTRLLMFVDGTQVADITDGQNLPDDGWVAGMSFGSENGAATTVTASQFTIRNLAA
jgi:hypothetical protein